MASSLMDLFRTLQMKMPQSAGQVPLGGMAGQAQQQLGGLPYQRYVQEMQALGQQPLPPEQWMMQQQQGGAGPQPGPSHGGL